MYSLLMSLIDRLLRLVAPLVKGSAKSALFVRERYHMWQRLQNVIQHTDESVRRVWIHASSLGEYGMVRPLIDMLLESVGVKIIVTFFSPTGVEAMSRRAHDTRINYFPLPIDSRHNASRWVKTVRPDVAIIAASDIWPNYIAALTEAGIDHYIVGYYKNHMPNPNSLYGRLLYKSLRSFKTIFTANREMCLTLKKSGFDNAKFLGNTLVDNAVVKAKEMWHDNIVERFVFTKGAKSVIAGSIHADADAEMVAAMVRDNTDVPFIIVPHEPTVENLTKIERMIDCSIMRFTQCNPETDFSSIRALVIDTVGSLAYIYRYGSIAYIGGGFTRYLHSGVEAAAYGLPMAWAPDMRRAPLSRALVECGAATIVANPREASDWCETMHNDPAKYAECKNASLNFVAANTGATQRIYNRIFLKSEA